MCLYGIEKIAVVGFSSFPLSPPPPNTASVVYIYICRRKGGWTVRHTSDVITRKRRDVQDVHLCQYVTFIEINRIPPAMVYGVYGSRKSVASHTVLEVAKQVQQQQIQ